MESVSLLQTGSDRFELLLGGGARRPVRFPLPARRELGLFGVPALHAATEAVRLLQERGVELAGSDELDLIAALGSLPAGLEELQLRLR